MTIGIVAIGRNEGERLKACLRSVVAAGPIVYVDSGSSDGSQDFARSLGVEVVGLAVPPNFTAARARNAGARALFAKAPETELIQFVDGDCEVQPGWLDAGAAVLAARPELALVFGRRRERFPDRSLYNALADDEWNVPVGDVGACGGDILIRRSAFEAVGGYPDEMIAGEEPDMCMRLRAAGWKLARIEGEMTLHDAAILRFGQWWNRTKRAGHAFAELAARHPDQRWPDWRAACRRITRWGGEIPGWILVGLMGGLVWSPWLLVLTLFGLGAFAANIARLFLRRRAEGLNPRLAFGSASLLMIGKLAEFQGLVRFRWNRLRNRRSSLIEYKGAAA
ncbi:GT2 family glycosyltransferase [Sphingomonas vulcanisoli]|uniref:GT2 family glycosyltransferase n=1 Tax=Sphingomonas vulcanisoli TaxID=1658060 RepID=A0ABX0TVZ7_9SPHN|nr:glycosyltransferase [Sphingomonas vulcanisoli]NIJ08879.1 GT2 family glycosyltransferase [Sphingomonas vulcanisoli]